MTAQRRNIMLGTAGHVDHGKSALVKLLTGCETDTLAEEKQRGLTIDLGFAPLQLADKRIAGIVDVPGQWTCRAMWISSATWSPARTALMWLFSSSRRMTASCRKRTSTCTFSP
jgi:translation elongation factor EF-Tu-like GTPase